MSKIGFIGQGWIGKNYADDFEDRGYDVVRYALEEPYCQNKIAIKECEIVFIAVPTPTDENGFNYEAVKNALENLALGTTAVIKSTLAPGTTELLQADFPKLFVMHSPEFLREATAAYDATNPDRNIVGVPFDSFDYQKRAEEVIKILPEAPYNKIMTAKAAELVKYAGNCFLMTKVLYMNLLYDLVLAHDVDWKIVREAMTHDPRIGESHTHPVHVSGHRSDQKTRSERGAGGHCFIKDFEVFRQLHNRLVKDDEAHALLRAMTEFNIKLLRESNKDLDLLKGVFGTNMEVK